MSKRVVFERSDRKWGWRLVADNGNIIATDGGQGYESEDYCRKIADAVVDGQYADADRRRKPLE